MEYICESSENEMLALFLQTEVKSERYRDKIFQILTELEADESIVLAPDMSIEEDNTVRKKIMSRFRGYGEDKELFEGFPKKVRWVWVHLSKSDLENVKYINYDYWVELSGGTRLAKNAAQNIRNGVKIFDVEIDGFIEGARQASAGSVFPPMILVSDTEKSNIIVLEGHFRLTVYMLAPDAVPDKLKVMVGYVNNEEFRKWGLY